MKVAACQQPWSFKLIDRRQLFVVAASTLLSAPSIVRAASLMALRGIILPTERHHYGFIERLYVHANLPTIIELQDAGLTAHEVAAVMTRRGGKSINDAAWGAELVIGVLMRDKNIRREDVIWWAERMINSS